MVVPARLARLAICRSRSEQDIADPSIALMASLALSLSFAEAAIGASMEQSLES